MSELKYKVGDEVLVKGTVAAVSKDIATIRVSFTAFWSWVSASDIVGPAKPEPETVPADPHGWRCFFLAPNQAWAYPPLSDEGFYWFDSSKMWTLAGYRLTELAKVHLQVKEVSCSDLMFLCGSLPPGYSETTPQPEFPHPMYLMWKGAAQ